MWLSQSEYLVVVEECMNFVARADVRIWLSQCEYLVMAEQCLNFVSLVDV